MNHTEIEEKRLQGTAYLTILNQSDTSARWMTRDREEYTLADMSPSHRLNLLRWLRRNAEGIVGLAHWGLIDFLLGPRMQVVGPGGAPTGETVRLGEPMGEMAQDAFDQMYEEEMRRMVDDPAGWLEEQPFVRTLVGLVEADSADGHQGQISGLLERLTL